jgi:hypothetical protein
MQQMVSLDLGTMTVWLGMSKAQLLASCVKSGYRPISSDDPEELYVADQVGEITRQVFAVRFLNGKLSYANRTWLTKSGSVDDAVIGAFATFNGKTGCSIAHAFENGPDRHIERVVVTCGSRSVLVSKGEALGMNETEVLEEIGQAEKGLHSNTQRPTAAPTPQMVVPAAIEYCADSMTQELCRRGKYICKEGADWHDMPSYRESLQWCRENSK